MLREIYLKLLNRNAIATGAAFVRTDFPPGGVQSFGVAQLRRERSIGCVSEHQNSPVSIYRYTSDIGETV